MTPATPPPAAPDGRATAVGVTMTVGDFHDVCRVAMLLRGRAYRVLEFTADLTPGDGTSVTQVARTDCWQVRMRLAGPTAAGLLIDRLNRIPGLLRVSLVADSSPV